VTDEEGAPLIGVNVLAQGTTIGTVTDLDGSYTLAFPDAVTELQFSYTGYATQSVAIGGHTQIDVTLQFGTALDEVVVTAIGIFSKGLFGCQVFSPIRPIIGY
jgi:hypothetical protein